VCEIPKLSKDRSRLIERIEDRSGHYGRPDFVHPKFERGDDPKISATPRTAQNRSSYFTALAVTRSPSAVTITTERILLQVAPNAPISQPFPPPKEDPAEITPSLTLILR
jgi:hypothetical protein